VNFIYLAHHFRVTSLKYQNVTSRLAITQRRHASVHTSFTSVNNGWLQVLDLHDAHGHGEL